MKNYMPKKLPNKEEHNLNPYDLRNAGLKYLKENIKRLKPKKYIRNPYEPSGYIYLEYIL